MKYRSFSEWPIIIKIITISAVSITFISLVIFYYFMPLIEDKMLDAKKEGVKSVIDVSCAILQEYETLARKGSISQDNAKKIAMDRLRTIRWNENEYVWITDTKSNMLMHPIKPDLEGTNLDNLQDINGKYFVREYIEVCRIAGSGYVNYMWPKPGREEQTRKISYVKFYEPWGWIIGSGIYIDDVASDVGRVRNYMLTGTLVFAVMTIALAFGIGHHITVPLKKVISGLRDIASGKGTMDLSKRIAITSIDEIGMLSTEFNSMMEAINNLSAFKKVIEEDDNLSDVYQRLGEVFTQKIGIKSCYIYQVIQDHNTIQVIFPDAMEDGKIPCNRSILYQSDLCKARRTGHLINSSSFPAICRNFDEKDGMVHYCFPVLVSGSTAAVIQFVFDTNESPAEQIESKLSKAHQYIDESLSVIATKRLTHSLREMALSDSLTQLHNRRYLQEYVEKIVAGNTRRGKAVGLIMCDLDFFKQVNDTHGHSAGDIVLKETANAIKTSVRDSDIVIRFGGEEFLVVLLDITEGDGMTVAEKIRLAVRQLKIELHDGYVVKKTISLGVSEFPPDAGSFWSCIKYADVALYKAKEEGRDRSVRFTSDMWQQEEI